MKWSTIPNLLYPWFLILGAVGGVVWGLVRRYADRIPIRASSDRLREAFTDTEKARLNLVDKIKVAEEHLVTQQKDFEKQLQEQQNKFQVMLDHITLELNNAVERGKTLERITLAKTVEIDRLTLEIDRLTAETRRLTMKITQLSKIPRKPKPSQTTP